MKKLEFHPLLKDVPLMPLHERDALATNIEKKGQLFPIVILNGMIIDGRNRYLACLSRNLEPKTIELSSSDPRGYVESVNYFRKHWTAQERSHFAALMSIESTEGRPGKTSSNELVTQTKAAEIMGVSVSSVKREKAKITGRKSNDKDRAGSVVGVGETDILGNKITAGAAPYWRRKSEVKEIINQIHAIQRKIETIPKDDPMYANVGLSGVTGDLKSAVNRLMAAVPAYLCPYCKGIKPDECKACHSRGVVSKYFWDTAVPKEMKPEMPF